jgi:hypothetical protein
MSNLETRKTKLQFTTGSTFRDGRKPRRIVVAVEPTYLTLNLYKTRARYSISFDAIMSAAVKLAVAAERREKLAAKKGGR